MKSLDGERDERRAGMMGLCRPRRGARTLGNVIAALESAVTARAVPRVDVESLAQLLLGACTQAGMVIARSANPKRTRRVVGTTLKTLIDGLAR